LALFDNVLGLALRGQPECVRPPGVEVRPSGGEGVEPWLDVVVHGFAYPHTPGVAPHDELPPGGFPPAAPDFSAAGRGPRRAPREGVIAGGARVCLPGGGAQLAGATTAPAHRRRGVQAALLSARLADAAAAGCDIAVVTTLPGSKSQQNVQSQGFELLYTRA